MELMLDTCGFLSLTGFSDKKLSEDARLLVERSGHVFISSCSLFEMAIKHKKGNIDIQPFGNAKLLWNTAIGEYGLSELPVTGDVFYESIRLPDHHGDPFDRIIIEEALRRRVPIVTHDAVFDDYGVETVR